MEKLRFGIIGIGNMGSAHARSLYNGEVPGAILTAVCDINPERLNWSKNNLGSDVQLFDNADDLFRAGVTDAVLIATPHYDHPPLAIKGFEAKQHVLIEKPAGVYTRQVRIMNDAANASGKVFGIMYNQRTNPLYQKLKDLIDSGELGEIRRSNWIITDWYRPQSYYDSGSWRASWAGEGGGVLINQAPHQLDLWQWICGMPKRIRAFCGFGKYHDIEVEDDVTAYVEYENGATGVFVTSTSDCPGSNRFEISGDMGKIVIEDGKLIFWRNRMSERIFNAEFKYGFGQPEVWKCEIPVSGPNLQHVGILRNFTDAILQGAKLLAPGQEGIRGLTLSNAMHLSAWTDSWVELPIDEELYLSLLQERIKNSSKKKNVEARTLDIDASF